VKAVAVLADGRVVTAGGDRRVLVWDPARPNGLALQLSCSAIQLAAAPLGQATINLAIAHQGNGFSVWSFTNALHEIPSIS
jgi:hypothetical protein